MAALSVQRAWVGHAGFMWMDGTANRIPDFSPVGRGAVDRLLALLEREEAANVDCWVGGRMASSARLPNESIASRLRHAVFSDHSVMSKANHTGAAIARNAMTGEFVRGRPVARVGGGMALVEVGMGGKTVTRLEDATTVLGQKAARALSKPGIDRSVVFRGPNAASVFSYSANPQDPTKVIREAADGTRAIGELVGGKFRVIKS